MNKQPEPLIGAAYDALLMNMSRIGNDKQAFLKDTILQDATLMRLLEAGEYLARVRGEYADYYNSHHTEAWNNLIGLRNIIAHGYAQVDREKVWDIMLRDVPELVDELKKLV
jgi:uncharacterized protein with HEPN domain